MSDNSNMQGFTLTSKEVKRLRKIHRKLRQRHEADDRDLTMRHLKHLHQGMRIVWFVHWMADLAIIVSVLLILRSG